MAEKEIKARIVRDRRNEQNFDMLREIEINKKVKWVSEGIGEDYKSWHPHFPIIVDAMTGFGKNTFIENCIRKYAREKNRKVLIISNRVANNMQLKRRIAKLVGCSNIIDEHNMLGINKQEIFDYVRILSYQKLNTYLDDASQIEELKSYYYVILDECHYSTSDALFNNHTWRIFNDSISIFLDSVRIYMTSTSQEILSEIVKLEAKLGYSNKYRVYSFNQREYIPTKEILYYKFKRDYRYINPYYFSKPDEIIDKIKADKSKNKWLVFVTNRKIGEKFVEEIGADSVLISKDSKSSNEKDGEIYKEIIKDESFSCKVLIATSVIDNGINLKDPLLKNIAIFSTDQVEFIQMVGRKRILDDETLNLFICNRDSKYFGSKLALIAPQLKAITHFRKNSYEVFFNAYNKKSDYELKLIEPYLYMKDNADQKLDIRINEFAAKKLVGYCDFYQEMIEKIKNDKDAFIKEVLGWLGLKKKFSPTLYINYVSDDTHKEEFIDFLKPYLDKEMSEEEFCSFGAEFKTKVNTCLGKQDNNRNGRIYKATRMRKIFFDYDLNYVINVKDKIYTLRENK